MMPLLTVLGCIAIFLAVVCLIASGAKPLPSWRVIYEDGKRSIPLRRDDAMTRAKLFGGVRVEYCRDDRGDLLP